LFVQVRKSSPAVVVRRLTCVAMRWSPLSYLRSLSLARSNLRCGMRSDLRSFVGGWWLGPESPRSHALARCARSLRWETARTNLARPKEQGSDLSLVTPSLCFTPSNLITPGSFRARTFASSS
jgi:hypothetical protein